MLPCARCEDVLPPSRPPGWPRMGCDDAMMGPYITIVAPAFPRLAAAAQAPTRRAALVKPRLSPSAPPFKPRAASAISPPCPVSPAGAASPSQTGIPPAATAARGGSRAHARPDCHAREDMHTPLARDDCEAGPGRLEHCRADGRRVSSERGARCQRRLLGRVGSRRQLVRPVRSAVQCVRDSMDGGRSVVVAAAAMRPHRAGEHTPRR